MTAGTCWLNTTVRSSSTNTPAVPVLSSIDAGTTLGAVENPDHIEPIAIDRRTLPPGEYTSDGYDVRQVIEG